MTGRSFLAAVALLFGILALATFWFPTVALLLALVAIGAAIPSLGGVRIVVFRIVERGIHVSEHVRDDRWRHHC